MKHLFDLAWQRTMSECISCGHKMPSSDTTDLALLTTALKDSYAIERELGAGGMATVYLAEDLKLRRKVAAADDGGRFGC